MEQKPVYTFAKWRIKEGNLPAVLNLLPELVQKSKSEAGNLFFKIHQSSADANILILFEGFTNEAALEQHRNSEHFKNVVVQQILPLLENREVDITNEILMK